MSRGELEHPTMVTQDEVVSPTMAMQGEVIRLAIATRASSALGPC
jgi:hypothetical protein